MFTGHEFWDINKIFKQNKTQNKDVEKSDKIFKLEMILITS